MDKLTKLLMSHDELEIVCQTQMAIILEMGLDAELERKLIEAKITPGFAQRCGEVKEEFRVERFSLTLDGSLVN